LGQKLANLIVYGLLALALVSLLALAAAPFSRSLVEQWSRRDVESRSRLIYNAIQNPLVRALHDHDAGRAQRILEGVARDERVLAVGLCDAHGALRGSTEQMPRGFSCEKVARSDGESFSSMVNGGRRVLVASFPLQTGGRRTYLVVLHDLSYLDARSGRAEALVVAALAAVAILVAGFVTILAAFVLQRWMLALRRAADNLRSGRPGLGAGDRAGMDGQMLRLLRDLKVGRAPTETPHVDWSPKTLRDLLDASLPGAEVIVVSNREPYIHDHGEAGVTVTMPASGLVAALEPIIRACGGAWIAHGGGSADRETVDKDDCLAVPPDEPAYRLRRIWISDEEQEGYYYGLANEGLWPLCHVAFVRPVFREQDWRLYERVNQRFADAVVKEARTDDPIVLVQDYHFALAPRMIRERLPRATIITFWHIPWPNPETFGICPWKQQILEGLLGSTIVGFHTQFHCNNFIETLDRFLESRIDRERSTVTLLGHETMVRPYPISIDWPPKAMAEQAPVGVARARLRDALRLDADAKLGVGVERFDYTKGILDRLRAIDLLLRSHPEWRGKFTFVQVAAPTRSKLATYRGLESEAVSLVEAINARHGCAAWRPIHLIIRHHEPGEVFELFRAADLCVVSSLHDGMNLVAKEFVASRDDEHGVLILSSFTGAARELSEALIVNPYDGSEMSEALDRALRMPAGEQRERMRLMRQHVREQNVYRWAGRMLIDAARLRQRRRILNLAGASLRT